MENFDPNKTPKKQILSAQIDLSKFERATDEEKRQQDVMSESTSFFKDGMRKLFKNPLAVASLIVLAVLPVRPAALGDAMVYPAVMLVLLLAACAANWEAFFSGIRGLVKTPSPDSLSILPAIGAALQCILMLANGGYTAMVEKMLDGVEIELGVDYLARKAELDKLADKIVYTGPVDAYFDYKLGALQYRSVRFETEVLDTDNYQGNAVVNYTDAETPYTRIIEHKHFEFGTQPKTVISREYSAEWKKGDEPYYPVNDEKNSALYAAYKQLADAEPGVLFGGRLGEYKYYDMDKVIEAALSVAEKELAE